MKRALLPILALVAAPAGAQEMFSDKTLRVVIGSAPGGSHDAYARLVARHLGARLPGKPNIILSNMPGASGVQAANYLYEIAPKDGTVFGTFNRSTPYYEAIGQGNVRFRSKNFGWLGSLGQANDTVVVWRTTGVRDIAGARQKPIIMGALSKIGTMYGYPALLNATIGTKFRVVTGYESGTAVNLAMETGELQGRGSNPWTSWKAINPRWIAEGKIVPLVQIGLRREPDLPDVPLLTDLAQTDEQKRLFGFITDTVAIDQPWTAPPGLRPETLAAMRAGFNAMIASAEFNEDARKQGLDLDPMSGEKLAELVARVIDAPRDVVSKVVEIMQGDGGAK